MMKKHFFKTFAFEFEATRLMWYAPKGGADFAEVATVCEKIKDGDYISWSTEWQCFAEKLENRASTFKSIENKANAFLRASRYYQAAEFFLNPTDSRKILAYNKSVELFWEALRLKGVTFEKHMIQSGKAQLRTFHFKAKNFLQNSGEKLSEKSRGTFFICGGFDALLEELYFTNAKSALENGYDVILFEGSGQSDAIRRFNLTFDENWQDICQKVVTYYEQKQKISGEKIGLGLSLGGLLMARAASFADQIFDKLVLYNYFPSMLDAFKTSLPRPLHRFLETGFPSILEKICAFYIRHNKFLNWQIEHTKWTFGGKTLNDLLKICAKFNETYALNHLRTPCLILLAKNDNYYNFNLGESFYQQIPGTDKKLIVFDKNNFSSDLHCQNGAAYDSNDQIFEWLQAH